MISIIVFSFFPKNFGYPRPSTAITANNAMTMELFTLVAILVGVVVVGVAVVELVGVGVVVLHS